MYQTLLKIQNRKGKWYKHMINVELEDYIINVVMDALADAFDSHLNSVKREWRLCLRGRYSQTFDKDILNTRMCIGWECGCNGNRITVGLGYHMDEKVKDFYYYPSKDGVDVATKEAIKYIHSLF